MQQTHPHGLHALTDLARMIKTPAPCDAGIAKMHDALTPGMTEQELWAVLHRSNIEAGGEWFETRLLTSGAQMITESGHGSADASPVGEPREMLTCW